MGNRTVEEQQQRYNSLPDTRHLTQNERGSTHLTSISRACRQRSMRSSVSRLTAPSTAAKPAQREILDGEPEGLKRSLDYLIITNESGNERVVRTELVDCEKQLHDVLDSVQNALVARLWTQIEVHASQFQLVGCAAQERAQHDSQ